MDKRENLGRQLVSLIDTLIITGPTDDGDLEEDVDDLFNSFMSANDEAYIEKMESKDETAGD